MCYDAMATFLLVQCVQREVSFREREKQKGFIQLERYRRKEALRERERKQRLWPKE